MGRGRAKAKQTKVARRLKYQTLDTDFTALQRELGHEESGTVVQNGLEDEVNDDGDDPYADYAGFDDEDEDEDEEDEDEDQPVRRR